MLRYETTIHLMLMKLPRVIKREDVGEENFLRMNFRNSFLENPSQGTRNVEELRGVERNRNILPLLSCPHQPKHSSGEVG